MADALPTPAIPPADAPVSTDILKTVVAFASTPEGRRAVIAVASLGGPISAAVGLLIEYGIPLVGSLLTVWGEPTLSRADLDAHLAAKGGKVVVFDPAAMFA